MAKPASSLYPHNISSILETAIRATSTKLDDLDVQKRLDVRLLAPSESETGWDVFILDYNVDGPIGTVKKTIVIYYLRNKITQSYTTIFFYLDFRAMQANVSNGIFCIVESKENGNDLICYLETTDNIGQNVQKNARSTANPKSYSSDY